jgi:membrane-bound serine protease (ClpP class)
MDVRRYLRAAGNAVLAGCAWLALSGPPAATAAEAGAIVILTIDGPISPATADYAMRGMRKAVADKAALVVLRIDTPGGLDTSMRMLVKEILASPVPIATFVAPGGARAASAGTFILYASHVAAMAPGTNLGAATPVQIGGPGKDAQPQEPDDKKAGKDRGDKSKGPALTHKQIEDAAAYIRSLAQLRGRNAEWGEQAVRDAVSLSAADALARGVIDLVVQDTPELLDKLDGRAVKLADGERKLQTRDAQTRTIDPDWRTRLLAVIANPSVALILMMIGIYGLILEFANPGFIVPGVAGAMCLLLAFYAFQLLPVDHTGIALILLGVALIIAEAFAPSFGALGIGGIAALAFGTVIFADPEELGSYAPSTTFLIVLPALLGTALLATVLLALKARRRPVVSGIEDLVGARGEALEDFAQEGWVQVRGERWRGRSSTSLARGQALRVTGISGLILSVEPE